MSHALQWRHSAVFIHLWLRYFEKADSQMFMKSSPLRMFPWLYSERMLRQPEIEPSARIEAVFMPAWQKNGRSRTLSSYWPR